MASDCHHHGGTRVRWTPREDGLEESVQFTPGYNCPVTGGRGHGVHPMEVTWLLRGPAGAVELAIVTDWVPGDLYPGHGLTPAGTRSWRDHEGRWSTDPRGWGVVIHSRRPQYEGHEPSGHCGLLDGECYWDRHLSGADPFVAPFLADGEQVIWDELEARYAQIGKEGGT